MKRPKRLFDEIKFAVGEALGTNEAWYTKTGLRELLRRSPSDRARMTEAVRRTREITSRFIGGTGGVSLKLERRETAITLKKVVTPCRQPEHVLERLYCSLVEGVYNRFNFLSGLTVSGDDPRVRQMTVDLVRATGPSGPISEMIELKRMHGGNPSDSPASALFELLMYHFLYTDMLARVPKRLPEVSRPIALSVLAPADYYEYWGSGMSGFGNLLEQFASDVAAGLVGAGEKSRPKLGFKAFMIDEVRVVGVKK